jgi:hypothetical protein
VPDGCRRMAFQLLRSFGFLLERVSHEEQRFEVMQVCRHFNAANADDDLDHKL